ncbi:MAG: hypothetical protein LBT06_16060 [Hungatella sp.]|jgi:aminomethyltransferase|nr:hypothetical protein [Hungatella sp.]
MKSSKLKKFYPEGYKITGINHCEVPVSYTDVEEEYYVLRDQIGMIDGIGYGIFNISGEGAADFLDMIATKDIKYMNIGTVMECLILNDSAEVLGIVFIERVDFDYIILIPPESAESVYSWMREKVTDDVVMKDLTEDRSLVFVEGHKSWKLVQEILKIETEMLPLRGLCETKWKNNSMVLSRIGHSGEYGYAVLAEHSVIEEFVETCLTVKNCQVKFCGTEAMDICMLEIRQPNLKYESLKSGNLFEMVMQWLIQFEKENYFGYKSMKELFYQGRNMLSVGFVCKEKKGLAGVTKVFFDKEEIGEVVYSKYSPKLEALIGILKIKEAFSVSGIQLDIKDDDSICTVQTVSSPFLRPASWDEEMV